MSNYSTVDLAISVWVDCPQGNKVAIHIWDYKKLRQDWEVGVSELSCFLDNAINTARSWGTKVN